MLAKPNSLKGDSVVVIGLGRFGASLARSLVASGHEVLAMDTDAEVVQALACELPHVVQADSTDEALPSLSPAASACAAPWPKAA